MDWFIETKAWEWMFSGAGVVLLAWIANRIWAKCRRKPKQVPKSEPEKQTTTGDEIHIQAGGDVSIAKDHGKSVQVKNAKVGVIGDHADIKGGIRFKDQE